MLSQRQEPFTFYSSQKLGVVARAKGGVGIEAFLSIPCWLDWGGCGQKPGLASKLIMSLEYIYSQGMIPY